MTPVRIANAIMQDSTFIGHYLIVEGKKDFKLYNKYIDKENKIREAWGCEKVKEVLTILEERGFHRKLGIIDSDFSKILDINHDLTNLFVTDFHDIEVAMIKSNALLNILEIFCDEQRLTEFKKEREITEWIFSIGKKLGYLKLANKIYGLGLVFKPKLPDGNQLKYKEFISERDLSFLGVEKMIQTVINYSRNKSDNIATFEEINEKYNEVAQNAYQEDQLVNGHDLTNILFILIKKVLRSNNKMLLDFNSIEDSLIMSYEANDFVQTRLFLELFQWSMTNGFNLFKGNVNKTYEHLVSGYKKAVNQ